MAIFVSMARRIQAAAVASALLLPGCLLSQALAAKKKITPRLRLINPKAALALLRSQAQR